MTDLLERLRNAEHGSRELDAAIDVYFRVGKPTLEPWVWKNFPNWTVGKNGRATVLHSDGSTGVWWLSEHFTTSIDAALALVKRVMPEANCVGFDKDPKGTDAYVSRNHVNSGHWLVEARANTPPIAICIALIEAKEKHDE